MKNKIQINCKSPEATLFLGKNIGNLLEKGNLVALVGDLGTGKTFLTKGIAEGLNLLGDNFLITSPTFTIINEYHNSKKSLYHIDVYRLQKESEFEEIGYEDYLYDPNGIIIIEWADKIVNLIPHNAIWILIKYINFNDREIIISGTKKIIKKFSQISKIFKEAGY